MQIRFLLAEIQFLLVIVEQTFRRPLSYFVYLFSIVSNTSMAFHNIYILYRHN